jgi:hypothetical protein
LPALFEVSAEVFSLCNLPWLLRTPPKHQHAGVCSASLFSARGHRRQNYSSSGATLIRRVEAHTLLTKSSARYRFSYVGCPNKGQARRQSGFSGQPGQPPAAGGLGAGRRLRDLAARSHHASWKKSCRLCIASVGQAPVGLANSDEESACKSKTKLLTIFREADATPIFRALSTVAKHPKEAAQHVRYGFCSSHASTQKSSVSRAAWRSSSEKLRRSLPRRGKNTITIRNPW